jgi:hypothetical protein
MTDSQWKSMWVKVFGSLYLLAVYVTAMNPRWRLAAAFLVSFALGWYLTEARYTHRSQQNYFFLGRWWTPQELGRLQSCDSDMLARAFPRD